jgi:hypothetical protein
LRDEGDTRHLWHRTFSTTRKSPPKLVRPTAETSLSRCDVLCPQRRGKPINTRTFRSCSRRRFDRQTPGMFRSCSRRRVNNGHSGVSFVLFRLGPIECPMAGEYDRATRSTLAFSGERGKRGAFAAGFTWGAIGVSGHADVPYPHAFKPHPQPARRSLDLRPGVPRVAGSRSGGQRQRERCRHKHHERSDRRDHDQ